MTRIYDDKGAIVPVTVVAGRSVHRYAGEDRRDTDGYNAVQLGFDESSPSSARSPLIGHAAKAGVGPKRHFREIQPERRDRQEARRHRSTSNRSTK